MGEVGDVEVPAQIPVIGIGDDARTFRGDQRPRVGGGAGVIKVHRTTESLGGLDLLAADTELLADGLGGIHGRVHRTSPAPVGHRVWDFGRSTSPAAHYSLASSPGAENYSR